MNPFKRSLALISGCGLCVMALTTAAQNQGFYLNADLGAALADNVSVNQFLVPTPGAKFELDTGIRLGVAGGYNFNEYVGLELETGYIYNSVKGLVGGGPNIDASLAHVPFIFNVVFRCDRTNSNWVPYFGAGAGGDASVINLDNTVTPVPGVTIDGSDVNMVFAWQAFAGVRYKIAPNMSIGAGYKYYQADGGSWDVQYNGNSAIQFGQARVHSVLVEFNMKF